MDKKMKRLCTICARGGSKGVKNKNIRSLLGKPLIAHTIEQATSSGMFDCISVSSDSDTILDIAKQWKADYLIKRPDSLASDHSGKLEAIKHCVLTTENLVNYEFDVIVDLDVTSPLRSLNDIKSAIELLETKGISNVITATPARRSPYFNLVELDQNDIVKLSKPLTNPILRRQDSPKCYDMNASIYVWWRDKLINSNSIFMDDTGLYLMPEERSIDIDTELDFEIVELIAKKRGNLS